MSSIGIWIIIRHLEDYFAGELDCLEGGLCGEYGCFRRRLCGESHHTGVAQNGQQYGNEYQFLHRGTSFA